MIDNGMITNLPPDSCAKGPIYADRTGLHPMSLGDLPPRCDALNLTNINVQRLAVEAALTGDPEHIVHAYALDPLTSAVLILGEIREIAGEMLGAQRQWLPQFAGRIIRPTPVISIPADIQRAVVPVDPALAILARFQELAAGLESDRILYIALFLALLEWRPTIGFTEGYAPKHDAPRVKGAVVVQVESGAVLAERQQIFRIHPEKGFLKIEISRGGPPGRPATYPVR